MAEESPKVETAPGAEGDDVLIEDTPGYKKPAPRALSEVKQGANWANGASAYKNWCASDFMKEVGIRNGSVGGFA